MRKYTVHTEKSWVTIHRETANEFLKWSRLRGRPIEWKVSNNRSERLVTLSYQHDGEPEVVLTMADQDTAEDNYRVLFLAVEAIRLNEVRGIADVVRAAYLALPPPVVERDPYEVLGVRSDTPMEVIQGAYRALARMYHPDNGTKPDPAKMAEVNAAWERLKGETSK